MDKQKLQRLALLLTLALLPSLSCAELYQWRDENGRVHFGDRVPEQTESQILQAVTAKALPAIDLRIEATEFEVSDEGLAKINTLIPQIFYLYRSLFGLDLRRTVEVKLYLLKDKPSFDAWMNARTGRNESLPYSGVFLTKSREVAVWKHSDDEEEVLGTILHESSHVIMAQLSPHAPHWLQEGMAEYFENMQQQNDQVVIVPPPRNIALLDNWRSKGQLITLRSYLSLPEDKWLGMAHNASAVPYTVAWATAYFMLSNDTGKRVLRRVLQDLEKSQRWPSVDDIDQAYPGGLTRMDYEFFKWAQQPIGPHSYRMQP